MTDPNASQQPGSNVKGPAGSCRSCGGSVAPWCGKASGFAVCVRCGLVARNPMPSDDELAAMYAEHYNDENIRGQTTHMESSDVALKNHAAYVKTHIRADAMKLLDFGAGSGTMVNLLRNQGCDIDGLEYSDNARAAARRLYQLDLLSNVAELRRAAYDAVLMIEVIEHLTDPPEVLRTLKHALKPGGCSTSARLT